MEGPAERSSAPEEYQSTTPPVGGGSPDSYCTWLQPREGPWLAPLLTRRGIWNKSLGLSFPIYDVRGAECTTLFHLDPMRL